MQPSIFPTTLGSGNITLSPGLVNGRMCSNDKGLLGCDSFLICWNKPLFAKQGSATGRTKQGWQPPEALM